METESSFFFQAEDGIRAGHVTGVQTCALPIFGHERATVDENAGESGYVVSHRIQHEDITREPAQDLAAGLDRKSTRLNSSHVAISYAVFCLKKKNTK